MTKTIEIAGKKRIQELHTRLNDLKVEVVYLRQIEKQQTYSLGVQSDLKELLKKQLDANSGS